MWFSIIIILDDFLVFSAENNSIPFYFIFTRFSISFYACIHFIFAFHGQIGSKKNRYFSSKIYCILIFSIEGKSDDWIVKNNELIVSEFDDELHSL